MKKVLRNEQILAITMACIAGGAALIISAFAIASVTETSDTIVTLSHLQNELKQIDAGVEKWLYLAVSAALLFFAIGFMFYFVPLLVAAFAAHKLAVSHPVFYGVATMVVTITGLLCQVVAGLIEPVGGVSVTYLTFHALPPFLAGGVYWYLAVAHGRDHRIQYQKLDKRQPSIGHGTAARFSAVALALILFSPDVFADRYSACNQGEDLDLRIVGCTEIIGRISEESEENRSIAHSNRGVAHKAQGNLEQAVADYGEAIVLNPNYATAYSNRANVYLAADQNEKAISDYSKAIEIEPKNPYTHNLRGLTYRIMGSFARAIADFDKAIEFDPNYANAYYNRARAYSELNQYDRAIADLDKAIKLNPNYDDAYNNRGAAYENSGNIEPAIADFRQALKINPKNTAAKTNLERMGVQPD